MGGGVKVRKMKSETATCMSWKYVGETFKYKEYQEEFEVNVEGKTNLVGETALVGQRPWSSSEYIPALHLHFFR